MQPRPFVVEVDENRFSVSLSAEGGPLAVETSAGTRELRPLRLDEHLAALERHVHVDERGLRFDRRGFCREVLGASGISESLHDELELLALWWACGGEVGEVALAGDEDGFIDVGGVRAKLRAWTFAERERAMRESLERLPDGSEQLRLETYLHAMVRASVVALRPPDATLDEVATASLLDAVVALNTAGEREEDRMVRAGDPAAKALAETTLRLCRALGWTPSEVWALPAAEIDRLLAVLRLVEAPAAQPRGGRPRGLADEPDAVVIQVEEG